MMQDEEERYLKFLIITFLIIFLPYTALANSVKVAECGDSKGYSYYAERGLMALNEGKSGWTRDAISGGNISLVINENMMIDFISKDALNEKSALSFGADIKLIKVDEKHIFLTTQFPSGVFNTHTFQKLSNGKYNVMWSQMISNEPLPKMASYVAECSYFNLEILLKLLK